MPENTEIGIVQIVEAHEGIRRLGLREIWTYRELLYFLSWRDLKVRYKQTVLGASWAILQPVVSMAVFSLFFGRWAGLGQKTGGTPYPLYVFTGLLPWTFFANAVAGSTASLINSANLLTKVYFPRILIPIASILTMLVDLVVSSVPLVILLLWYRVPIGPRCALVLPVVGGTLVLAIGVGAFLSAMTVEYRDFRYVVPFLIQVWFFVTPILYPASLVPRHWGWVLWLNPMAGLVEGFRAAMVGEPTAWGALAGSLTLSGIACMVGIAYFRGVERGFADVV